MPSKRPTSASNALRTQSWAAPRLLQVQVEKGLRARREAALCAGPDPWKRRPERQLQSRTKLPDIPLRVLPIRKKRSIRLNLDEIQLSKTSNERKKKSSHV